MTKNSSNSEIRSLLQKLMVVACLAVGIFFAFRATSPDARAVSSAATTARSVEQTVIADSTGIQLTTQNIEDIRLGQRVVGTNPLREQTQPASCIDPKTWRAVRLTMYQSGVKYDLAFLRSESWLEATGARVGGSIHMELDEMGLNGPADVIGIDPCPEIEPDDGTGRNVVTGTMAHPGPNILYLDITGLDEPLGVTDTHPIWSETRQDFVQAAFLKIGEQFRTLTGETATLTRITPHRGPPETVFNLEVDAQHVYAVASRGLLVHNACGEVQVTSWADPGTKPDLTSGRWVMLGGPTKTNFWKSGLPGPKYVDGKIRRSTADFANSITQYVDPSRIKWPKGLEMWKGLFGQRILN